ncbi:uncharacterized protein LOC121868805 isoform X2 [Homarus americanus]|uniref:uncharacterized protein LOC121868805 isoform X2 n=1 Tax=Homarus americanus TaxID=6706 RepID=UPI001C49382A|nr:uncharacterized protein LOC121868805 isoform X2 [Homarus americanus]
MGSSGHVGVFWAWVEGATDNMAFALDGLVEQVRSWVAVGGLSGLGLASIMDTLNTLLVGWMIFVALILIIGTFFYFKFIYQYESGDLGRPHDTQPRGEPKDEKNKTAVKKSAPGRSGPEVKPAEPARKPTIVPDRSGEPVTAPVATGADPDAVKWTNNVFTWLYNSVDGGPAIRKTWLDTVNENTVKTALQTGILVEVVEVYKVTAAPTLSNMVVDCSPTDNVTITCDCDATIYLRIMTTRTQGETTTESEYACAVSTLRGRLNIASITSELMAVVKFDGWPEVALELEGIRNNSTGLNEQQMLDVVDEVLTSALRNSVLDVNFQSSKTFPKFRRARQVPDPIIPVGYDSMVSALPSTTTGQSMGIPGLNGKRLLVKIVKATSVGCDKSVCEAYAVVEMDEPPQKFTTSVVKDTSSPFWDEQFLFDLSGGTLELLFEVYDKKDGNFLGLGIVGIEELVATPSQRQIIPLQSRPYENDEVSGSLTVEFLFLDRADLPEHTLRSSATSQSLTSKGDLITTTTTTYVKAPELQDVIVNGGDGVAAVALRDIEEKKTVVANNASKSTMIIHASRKEVTKKVIQVQRAPSGEYKELTVKPDEEGEYPEFPTEDLTALTTTATTTTPIITTTSTHSTAPSTSLSPTTTTTSTTNATTNADAADPLDTDERGRSRGSRRKRDSFFGTLKKRFSRSKVRSKSMDPSARDTSMDRDASVGRSISAERSANLNRASEQQQVNPPSLRDTIAPTPAHYLYLLHAQRLLSVPANVGGDGGSTRSSLSDASAISSSSTRTYVNEASTLIIETSENGVFKHYLIPLALQQKSKWRKKGLKLHIFGEHTFLAKHMSSTTPCEVCHKTLGRRFGKQGYVCRDCGFKCHKPCHVKTEIICPNSTVNSMDLEYVKDPREERRAWLRKARAT